MTLNNIKQELNIYLSNDEKIINIFWNHSNTTKELVVEIKQNYNYDKDYQICKKINKLFKKHIDNKFKKNNYILNIITIKEEERETK